MGTKTDGTTAGGRQARGGRRARSIAGLVTACLIVVGVSACGSDGGSSSSGGTTVAGSGADIGPVKLALMWEVKGESPNAIDDAQNGAQLAIDEINAAGGVGGKPVEAVRISTSVSDPQQANTAFQKAVDAQPTAVIGYLTAVIDAVVPSIERAGIPTLATAQDDKLRYGSSTGSEWLFNMSPLVSGLVTEGTNYLTGPLKAKTVGVLATNEATGLTNAGISEEAITKAGATVGATREVPTTSTDLTEPLLAVQSSDAVAAWIWPNLIGLLMNQMEQSNVSLPVMTTSAPLAVANGLAKGSAITNLYGATPCSPLSSSEPQAKAYVQSYQKRFNNAYPSSVSALAYDAVYVAAEAVKKAGSTEPGAVQGALREITWKGVCDPAYRSDGAQIMNHHGEVVGFSADGAPKTVSSFTIPPAPKAS